MKSTGNENVIDDLVQNLLPTLIQCFGTILLGFIFGKTKLLQEDTAKGLCIFLQYLSLPSLIFVSLATLSLTHVKWDFVAALLVTKTLVFLLVVALTMLLTNPLHLGKSGIYAIAATQSNDIALGYPLMVSLYKNINQDYPLIIYFVFPIQLLLLNPAGFFMMETYKQLNDPVHSEERKLFVILRGILKNPVIVMTILGLTWNLALDHRVIPPVLSKLLDALGFVFPTLALFSLGYGMSIRRNVQLQEFSLSSALLVLAKILLLPLLLQRLTVYFLSSSNELESQNLSSLGFLYGTIPIAPSVFVFAKHYNIAVDTITSATVYSTLFSAPLMITSALMISFNQDGDLHFDYYLNKVICFTGAANLFCCLLLAFIFSWKRLWHNIYNIGPIYVIFAQVLSSIASVLLFFNTESRSNIFYAGYILQTVGLHCTFMYTVFTALLIFLLKWKSLCFILQHGVKIKVTGFIAPIVTSFVIAFSLFYTRDSDTNDCFEIGKPQHIATLTISTITFLSTVSLLILCHRHHVKNSNLSVNNKTVESSDDSSDSFDDMESLITKRKPESTCCSASNTSDNIKSAADYCRSRSECMMSCSRFCNSNQSCSREQRIQCSQNVENYENEVTHNEDLNSLQHYKYSMIFLLSLSCCMILSIADSLSKTIVDTGTGAFLEVQFLYVVLRNGQGILCFCLLSRKKMSVLFHKIVDSLNFKREV